MSNKAEYLGVYLGIFAIIALVCGLTSAVIFYAWNLVISPVFNVDTISFLQAFLLGVLINIIKGGVRSAKN